MKMLAASLTLFSMIAAMVTTFFPLLGVTRLVMSMSYAVPIRLICSNLIRRTFVRLHFVFSMIVQPLVFEFLQYSEKLRWLHIKLEYEIVKINLFFSCKNFYDPFFQKMAFFSFMTFSLMIVAMMLMGYVLMLLFFEFFFLFHILFLNR